MDMIFVDNLIYKAIFVVIGVFLILISERIFTSRINKKKFY